MTVPRQVLEGATYLVTRRCSERRFFLRPSKVVNQVFLYVLAIAAERYGIWIHSVCVLSNHYHLVLTDPDARLPDFNRYLDGLVARAINCVLGRWESFWDPDSYSAVRLETAADVLEKMVYVLGNPVLAGLVRHGSEWPGLWSNPDLIGGAATVAERPKEFFRENGPLPASASLQLRLPPGFEGDASLVELLRQRLGALEAAAAADLARDGRSPVGAVRVLAQSPNARPVAGEPRRGLNPRIACRNKWGRIEALLRLREFARAYRKALADWRAGLRDVLFPPGTWLMRVQHAARCASGR
jgi:REP element-mobilizing transposase RayT